MARVVTSKDMLEVFDKWHGNFRGGTMTIEALSMEYSLKPATMRAMVRYLPPYDRFINEDIVKEIKRIKAIDPRSVTQIEKSYLRKISGQTDIEEQEQAVHSTLQEITLYYIAEFVEKYVQVYEDDFKSKGISVPLFRDGLTYSIEHDLITYDNITVNENGSYTGSHVSVLYKQLTEELGLSKATIVKFMLDNMMWALRDPDLRWDNIVTQFIRKDRGHDWYTGKKTQIYNQWQFKPELEELLQIEPIYKY